MSGEKNKTSKKNDGSKAEKNAKKKAGKKKTRRLKAHGKGQSAKSLLRAHGDFFLTGHYLTFIRNMALNSGGNLRDCDIFEALADIMPRKDLMDILSELGATIKRFGDVQFAAPDDDEEDVGDLSDLLDFSSRKAKDIYLDTWNHTRAGEPFRDALADKLGEYIEILKTIVKKDDDSDDPHRRTFSEMKDVFELSDTEEELLVLRYLSGTGFMDSNDLGSLGRGTILTATKIFSYMLGVPLWEVTKICSEKGRLRRLGCLDDDLDITNEARTFLSGMSETPLLSSLYYPDNDEPLPWDYYGELVKTHGETLKKLLLSGAESGKGVNILFYGAPGTGKSSLAATLAAQCGLTAYKVAGSKEAYGSRRDHSKEFRFAAIQVGDERLTPKNSMLVVDEADNLLGGPASGFFSLFGVGETNTAKGLLNEILDKTRVSRIWIANVNASAIAPSCRRRFDYSVRFDKLPSEQRAKVWMNVAQKRSLDDIIDPGTAEQLSAAYEIEPGGVDLALSNVASLGLSGKQKDEAMTIINAILERHCELLGIPRRDYLRLDKTYSLEGLNIDGDVGLDEIAAAVERVRSEPPATRRGGIKILMYGPPGTGKTEYAKYLASRAGAELIVKTPGDILDKYVGETEARIKAAFREAHSKNAFLFFDEIEGLIRSRAGASHSWEVTCVNELLTGLENFRGIVFCASNFKDAIDAAAIRRFTFKLGFDYLDDTGKMVFYNKMLKPLFGDTPLTSREKRKLLATDKLTPGDFKTVRERFLDLGRDQVSHKELVAALTRERSQKNGNRKIGF